MSKEKTSVITVTLPVSLKKKVEKAAEKKLVSLASFVRAAILEKLNKT